MSASPVPVRRPVLVLDQEPDRLDATAKVAATAAPDARILLLHGAKPPVTSAVPMEAHAADTDKSPDVILVWAEPGSWAAASVLAAHHPPRLGRPVDAFLVAEGPLEKYPVLITDSPGLRLLPPGSEVAAVVAGLVRGNAAVAR